MLRLWEKIIEVGNEFKILPVGSEASHVLRVEKGFLSLGHEVDGTVDAYDLGMSWLMSKKKIDYIGKRSVNLRRGEKSQGRRELVGLLTRDPNEAIPGWLHLDHVLTNQLILVCLDFSLLDANSPTAYQCSQFFS